MENGSSDSITVDDEQVSDLNIVCVNIDQQSEYPKLKLTKIEEEDLYIRDLRIQFLNNSYKYDFRMQTLEVQLQDLTHDNEEEKLMNLQYQDQNRDLVSKNDRLKDHVKQLTEEKKELAERLKQYERGLKRKSDSEDSVAKLPNKHSKSPDTSTSDEKEANLNDQNVILELRRDNLTLLHDKDESRRQYEHCYKYYVEMKKKLDRALKDNHELKSMKVGELTKDPRITSLICKDKDQEVKDLKEKYNKLKAQLIKYHPQNVDTSKVKRERTSNEIVINDEASKNNQSELADLRKKVNDFELSCSQQAEKQNILEDRLKKKESELIEKSKANKEYCNALNVSKKKLIETNRSMDTLKKEKDEIEKTYKKKIAGFEQEVQELKVKQQKAECDLEQLSKDMKEERQKVESDRQQLVKDLEHKYGLEAMKLRNQHEQEINKMLTQHAAVLNNLRNEMQKHTDTKDSMLVKELEKWKQDFQNLQNDQEFSQAELIKYKKLYSQYHEESQKKMNCANNLTKEIDDMREKNTLLIENNHFLRQRIVEQEKMIIERNYYIQKFMSQSTVQSNLQANHMMPTNRIPNNMQISQSATSPQQSSPATQISVASSPVPTIPTVQTNMNNSIQSSNINHSTLNELPPTYQSFQQLKSLHTFAQQSMPQTFVQPFFGSNQVNAVKDNGNNKKK